MSDEKKDGYTVEHVPRGLIENRLLVTLTEEDQVAMLLTREDLDALIEALKARPISPRAANILEGALLLRRNVYEQN